MKKSAKIQGKVKELQDKYSNDPVRFNEEIKNLYAENNMSPFSRMFRIYFTTSYYYFDVYVSK